MANINVDLPDNFIPNKGVIILAGWERTSEGSSAPKMLIFPYEETEFWGQLGLVQSALRRITLKVDQSWTTVKNDED